MPELTDWTGTCRGPITDYKCQTYPSGAVLLEIAVSAKEYWDADKSGWFDCEEGLTTSGRLCLITKKGTVNKTQIEALVAHAGLPAGEDGFIAIQSQAWQPSPCSYQIKQGDFNGEPRWEISWLNAYDHAPSGQPLSAEKAQQLQNKYGSQLRAIAGNVTRNVPPPAESKPSTPGFQPTAEELEGEEGAPF